jgi:hypothetical protein
MPIIKTKARRSRDMSTIPDIGAVIRAKREAAHLHSITRRVSSGRGFTGLDCAAPRVGVSHP